MKYKPREQCRSLTKNQFIMALNYFMVQRANPTDREAERKWYPQVEIKGKLTFDGLTQRIATASTASEADCSLVLKAMVKQIILALNDGMSVEMEDIGTLLMGVKALGSEDIEDWNISMVKSKRILFRPCAALKSEAKKVSLNRVLPRERTK
ncbi:MAG: HU family DNA-binding protein [Phocaeicola sp.]